MGALPHFGAPQGDILWKTKNDFLSQTARLIKLTFDVEHQGN